jgi:hypothetical protein
MCGHEGIPPLLTERNRPKSEVTSLCPRVYARLGAMQQLTVANIPRHRDRCSPIDVCDCLAWDARVWVAGEWLGSTELAVIKGRRRVAAASFEVATSMTTRMSCLTPPPIRMTRLRAPSSKRMPSPYSHPNPVVRHSGRQSVIAGGSEETTPRPNCFGSIQECCTRRI